MVEDEKFILVLFVDDPGEMKNIDIVPAGWVYFDEQSNKLVTPFISDSSTKSFKMSNTLVKSESEPPKTWPIFPIEIRGYARK